MLEKLITNIKESLPGALRKKTESAQQKIPQPNEKIMAQAIVSGAEEEEKAKKRNSMIFRVIIIVGIAYFAVDEFVLKEMNPTEPTTEEIIAAAAKKKKKKTTLVEAETVSPENAQAQNPEIAPASEEAPVIATEEVAPPIENVNVLGKTEPVVAETPVVTEPEPAPEIISSTIVPETNVIDQKIDQLVETVDQTQNPVAVEEIKVPSQPQPEQTNQIAQETQPKNDFASMASKIAEDVEETAAPAYDQVGRGLVYNCKDKYWACLNKPAFLVCNKNMKWNKSKGNPAECVVKDIYSTDEDCAKVQKFNVSTSMPTAFCN